MSAVKHLCCCRTRPGLVPGPRTVPLWGASSRGRALVAFAGLGLPLPFGEPGAGSPNTWIVPTELLGRVKPADADAVRAGARAWTARVRPRGALSPGTQLAAQPRQWGGQAASSATAPPGGHGARLGAPSDGAPNRHQPRARNPALPPPT
jgi:hypothetical protein